MIDLSLRKNFHFKEFASASLVGRQEHTIARILAAVVSTIVGIFCPLGGIALYLTWEAIDTSFVQADKNRQIEEMRRQRLLIGREAIAQQMAQERLTWGSKVNTRQSNDAIRVIYGIVKTGGTWVMNKMSRLDNTVLNAVISWGEGEFNGIATGIEQYAVFSGTTTLNDLNTAGQFIYAACNCDMSCYSYGACVTCNMQHD